MTELHFARKDVDVVHDAGCATGASTAVIVLEFDEGFPEELTALIR